MFPYTASHGLDSFHATWPRETHPGNETEQTRDECSGCAWEYGSLAFVRWCPGIQNSIQPMLVSTLESLVSVQSLFPWN